METKTATVTMEADELRETLVTLRIRRDNLDLALRNMELSTASREIVRRQRSRVEGAMHAISTVLGEWL